MKKLLSIMMSVAILISIFSVCAGLTVTAEEKEQVINNTGNTYYVDAESGNDRNDGLTPETAWKTIDKVNKTTFEPGSAILLKRGCVWTNTFLWPKGTGDKDNINYISCYGDENEDLPYVASLYDDALDGLPSYDTCLYLGTDQNYWDISNLSLYNSTNGTGDQSVVYITNSNNSNRMKGNRLHHCVINGSNPSNWSVNSRSGLSGINVVGWIDEVFIEYNEVSNVKTNGIGVNGWRGGCNQYGEVNNDSAKGVVIRGNTLYNIGKDGILPNNCNQPLVEYNVCGKAHSYAGNTAHVAMWPFACYGSLFQYNEAYDTKTIYDGQGFDCDYLCYNTTFQYNYSHDNEGGFMLICTEAQADWLSPKYAYNVGSTVRYNISQGDKHYIFSFCDAVEDTRIYNNTIYASRNTGGNSTNLFFSYDKGQNLLNGMNLPHNTLIANNIFWIDKMERIDLSRNTETVLKNNLYAGKNFKNAPANGTVTTKTDSNGNEVYLYREVSDNIIGADPLFVKGGYASLGRESCDVYKLYEGSEALGSGIYIEDGFHPCPNDFYGNPIDKNNVNIGAYQGEGVARPQYVFDNKYHKMIDFEDEEVGAKGMGTSGITMSGIDRITEVTNTSTAFVDITDDYNALNSKTKSTKALRLVNTGATDTTVNVKFYTLPYDLKNANGFRIFFNPNGEQQDFTVTVATTVDGKTTNYSKTVTVKNPEYRVFTFNEKYSSSSRVKVENMRKMTHISIKATLHSDREVYIDDIQLNKGEMDEIEASEKFYNEKADVTLVEDFETTTVGSNTNYANCWSGPKSSPAGGSAVSPNGTKAIFLTNSSNTNTGYSGGYTWSTAFNKLKSALASDTTAEGLQFDLITVATIGGVEIDDEQKYAADGEYNKYTLSFSGATLKYTTVGGVEKTVSSFSNSGRKLQTDPNNLCRIPFADLYTTYTEEGVTYKVYLTDFSAEDQQRWKSNISNIGVSCSTFGTRVGGVSVLQYIYLDNLAIYKNVQHEAGNWQIITSPTCTRDGMQTKTCTICNRILETKTDIAPGHTYGEWIVTKEAECEIAGESQVSCTVCKKVIETKEIKALTHDYKLTTVPPTCIDDGYDAEICKLCNNEKNKTNIVTATGHEKTKWVIDTAASCDGDGASHEECEKCGEVLQTAVELKGHRFVNTVVEPTCTADGYTLHKCKSCQYQYTSDKVKATGHTTSEEWTVTKNASCSVAGEKVKYCTLCKTVMEIEAIAVTQHEESEEWTVTKNPTCTAEGTRIKYCKFCYVVISTEIVKPTGHKAVVKGAVEATYFNKGFTGDTYCSICNEKIASGKAVAMLKLTKPTVKSATPAKRKITVKYKKVSGATGYEIQIKKSGKWQKFTTKKLKYTLKKLVKGKRYKVRVRAFVKSGSTKKYSKFSKTKTVKSK